MTWDNEQSRRPVAGRSVVSTRLGIVAANHPVAAAAGVNMLERGGNAIDAAISFLMMLSPLSI